MSSLRASCGGQQSYILLDMVAYDGKTLQSKTIDSSPYPLQLDRWYTVHFEAKADDLRLFIDDKLVLSGTDPLINTGSMGYYMGGDEEANFDDIKVWSLTD